MAGDRCRILRVPCCGNDDDEDAADDDDDVFVFVVDDDDDPELPDSVNLSVYRWGVLNVPTKKS